MKVIRSRQKPLSFKITDEIEAVLIELRIRISRKMNRTVTKTEVIEEAIRTLAKREKVECGEQ